MAEPRKKAEEQMTAKQLLTVVGSVVAAMGVVGTILAQVVVPAILNDCRTIIMEELERHEGRPHKDAVNRHEFNRLMDKLESIEADVKEMMKGK